MVATIFVFFIIPFIMYSVTFFASESGEPRARVGFGHVGDSVEPLVLGDSYLVLVL